MKNRILAIIKKEFIHIRRDPRSLAVALLMPIIMLTLFGYGITFDVKHFPIAIYDCDHSFRSRELIRSFSQSEYLEIVAYPERTEEIKKLLDGEIAKAVIIIPPDFTKKLSAIGARLPPACQASIAGRDGQGSVPLQILVNGSDANTASVAMGYINTILQNISFKLTPINVETRVWYNPELKSVIFIVPGVIVIILMMLSAVLTSMTIVGEKEKGTIEQLISSPVKPLELMLGKLVPYILLAGLDIVLITALGYFIFGMPIRGNLALFFSIATLFLFCALGIGMFISTVARTQQEAMMLALIGTLLPSILLSGFVFPIASMPTLIQAITYLIPARYFLVVARSIFLKGTGIAYFWPEVLMLAVFAVLVITASAKRFKKKLD